MHDTVQGWNMKKGELRKIKKLAYQTDKQAIQSLRGFPKMKRCVAWLVVVFYSVIPMVQCRQIQGFRYLTRPLAEGTTWRGHQNTRIQLKLLGLTESYSVTEAYTFYMPESVQLFCHCHCWTEGLACPLSWGDSSCPTCYNVSRTIPFCIGRDLEAAGTGQVCCRARVEPGTSKYRAFRLVGKDVTYKFELVLNGTVASVLLLSSNSDDPAEANRLIYADPHLVIRLRTQTKDVMNLSEKRWVSSTQSGSVFGVSPCLLNDLHEWDPRKLGWMREQEGGGRHAMTSHKLLRDVTQLRMESCPSSGGEIHQESSAFLGLLRSRAQNMLTPLLGPKPYLSDKLFILSSDLRTEIDLEFQSQETFTFEDRVGPFTFRFNNVTVWTTEQDSGGGGILWLTGRLETNATSRLSFSVSVEKEALK